MYKKNENECLLKFSDLKGNIIMRIPKIPLPDIEEDHNIENIKWDKTLEGEKDDERRIKELATKEFNKGRKCNAEIYAKLNVMLALKSSLITTLELLIQEVEESKNRSNKMRSISESFKELAKKSIAMNTMRTAIKDSKNFKNKKYKNKRR